MATLSERLMVVALRGVVPGDDQHVIADAMAAHDELVAALTEIAKQYSNQNINHEEYRVAAFQTATAALSKAKG